MNRAGHAGAFPAAARPAYGRAVTGAPRGTRLRCRFRKCCAGLTVCTCRIGHRCKCEGCNCS